MTACSPAAIAITQPASDPQSATTEVPPPTPAPTFTPAVLTVDQKVEAYLNGEIDNVGDLSSQELAEFSSKLAEKKNAERGINPITYNNEAYINPDNYMMMDYDGHPDMNETIQMYMPIAGKDEQGNLQFEVDGQIVTILGSADVDWNMQISKPDDPRIIWPDTELAPNTELTGIEYAMTSAENRGAPITLLPMILPKKNVGQIYTTGLMMQSTFVFFRPETDSAGHPILARKILVSGAPDFNLVKEGSDFEAHSTMHEFDRLDNFQDKLVDNQIYYLGGSIDQARTYDRANFSRNGYKGLVELNDTYPVLTGKITNNKDMINLAASWLMQKNVE